MSKPKPELIGRTPGSSVPVYIGAGLARKISHLLDVPRRGQKLALVTDNTVGRLYAARLRETLTAAGWKIGSCTLAPGERVKSEGVIRRLHESWFRAKYDRSTHVIALGGGTIGDAVGFAAATFMRGLPLWHVPTTIVGQVDSALGGKVGINHPRGKNLIGCFYHPCGVLIDPEFLTTLPNREIRAGLAEVVKYGVIADAPLFRRCEAMLPSWISKSRTIDREVIKRCAAIKLSVVQSDERDSGKRHVLNLGHTLGHAFEAWGKYRSLRHGEAVALGMVAAAHMAQQRGKLTVEDFKRILSTCQLLAPKIRAERMRTEAILPYLATDKKRQAGQNAWVLPIRIGKVTIVRDVTDKEIRAAIAYVREWLDSAK